MHTHKLSRSNREEALCREVLLYLLFETRFAVYSSNMRWKEVPCNNGSTVYNTVRFLEFVLDLGTVKIPLVACLVGYVYVSELCVS